MVKPSKLFIPSDKLGDTARDTDAKIEVIETLNSVNKDLGKDISETKLLMEKRDVENMKMSRQVTVLTKELKKKKKL